jgi:hypothetical protein
VTLRRSLNMKALAVAASWVVISVETAGAQPHAERDGKVSLTVEACPESFESSLRKILRIELGELLDETTANERDRESIDVICELEIARVSARSASRVQVAHNDLRFDTFPGDAAPRAVALAALEALRAVDPTLAKRLEAQRKRANAPAGPRPAARTRPASSPARRVDDQGDATHSYTRVVVGGVARFFLASPRTTGVGARAELGFRFAAPWDLGFDIEGAFARQRVDLGVVDARLVSTAAWFGARTGSAAWSLTAALGGRLGIAALRGTPEGLPARGHDVVRPWAGPVLVARADGSLDTVAFVLMTEGGFAARGAEGLAGGASAVGIKGGWFSASVGAGVRF